MSDRLIDNNPFADNGNWSNLGAEWDITGGELIADNAEATDITAQTVAAGLSEGTEYTVGWSLTNYSLGTFAFGVGGAWSDPIEPVGDDLMDESSGWTFLGTGGTSVDDNSFSVLSFSDAARAQKSGVCEVGTKYRVVITTTGFDDSSAPGAYLRLEGFDSNYTVDENGTVAFVDTFTNSSDDFSFKCINGPLDAAVCHVTVEPFVESGEVVVEAGATDVFAVRGDTTTPLTAYFDSITLDGGDGIIEPVTCEPITCEPITCEPLELIS